METTIPPEKSETTPSWRAAWVIVSVATAFAHEYGFWNIFHIAILEHVGLTDLPRLALWPVFTAASAAIVGIAIAAFDKAPTPVGQSNGVGDKLWVIAFRYPGITGLLAVAVGCWLAFFAEPRVSAVPAPILLAFGGLFLIRREPTVPGIGVVISRRMVFVAVWVLGTTYGWGVVEAIKIRDGESYLLATFASQPSDSLRYLRRVGDYVFLYDPNRRAAELFSLEDIQPLQLKYVKKHTVH